MSSKATLRRILFLAIALSILVGHNYMQAGVTYPGTKKANSGVQSRPVDIYRWISAELTDTSTWTWDTIAGYIEALGLDIDTTDMPPMLAGYIGDRAGGSDSATVLSWMGGHVSDTAGAVRTDLADTASDLRTDLMSKGGGTFSGDVTFSAADLNMGSSNRLKFTDSLRFDWANHPGVYDYFFKVWQDTIGFVIWTTGNGYDPVFKFYSNKIEGTAVYASTPEITGDVNWTGNEITDAYLSDALTCNEADDVDTAGTKIAAALLDRLTSQGAYTMPGVDAAGSWYHLAYDASGDTALWVWPYAYRGYDDSCVYIRLLDDVTNDFEFRIPSTGAVPGFATDAWWLRSNLPISIANGNGLALGFEIDILRGSDSTKSWALRNDSIIAENASTNYIGNLLKVETDSLSADYIVTTGSGSGQVVMEGATSGSGGFGVQDVAGSPALLLLPITDGSNGDQLTTDGAGNLSWAAAGGAGGSQDTVMIHNDADTDSIFAIDNRISLKWSTGIDVAIVGDTATVSVDKTEISLNFSDLAGSVADGQIANDAVDGGTDGEIQDGTITAADMSWTSTPGSGEDNYVVTYNYAANNFTAVAGGGGGTSDSIGYATDAVGTGVDAWLYPAFFFEGDGIGFTITGEDSLSIYLDTNGVDIQAALTNHDALYDDFSELSGSLDSSMVTDGDLSIDDIAWRTEWMELTELYGWCRALADSITAYEGYWDADNSRAWKVLDVAGNITTGDRDTLVLAVTVPYACTIDSFIVTTFATGDSGIVKYDFRGPDVSNSDDVVLDSSYQTASVEWGTGTRADPLESRVDLTNNITAAAGDKYGLMVITDFRADNDSTGYTIRLRLTK
jgi:hypothetical protein